MATITTVSHGNYLQSPRIQYISVTAFHNDIYQYTTTVNPQTFVTTGALTSLGSLGTATVTNCPANRVLRANGKKLYPPGLITANSTSASAGPYPGVTTYMVGVYDPVTGLSGYIDPNSQVFAVYNTDKPEYVPRGLNPNGGAVDQGPPVYSLGLGQFGTFVNVGSYISTGGAITSGGTVGATSGIGYVSGNGYPGVQTVTQGTSRTTDVTEDGVVVDITLFTAVLNAHDQVAFTFNNSSIGATDTLLCVHLTTGVGKYVVYGKATGAGTATITLGNVTASNSASEAPVIRVYVLKS